MATDGEKMLELERILKKYSIQQCKIHALPLLEVNWTEVKRMVIQSRYPLNPSSVAKCLTCIINEYGLQERDIGSVLALLNLKSLSWTMKKDWYTIKLLDCLFDEDPTYVIGLLCKKVCKAVEATVTFRNKKLSIEVHAARMDEFIYMSVCAVPEDTLIKKQPLYIALPNYPGVRAMFVTSLNNRNLLQAIVEGLGYHNYKYGKLVGQHLPSLLRILRQNTNVNMNKIIGLPKYDPKPIATRDGIDFMNAAYNEDYVDNLLGPDPPILNFLELQSNDPFYDEEVLNRRVNISLNIKSKNIANILKEMAKQRVIAPNSEWFALFQSATKNRYFLR